MYLELAFCLAIYVQMPLAVDTGRLEDFHDPGAVVYQTIFFGVLEGAFRDGLSSEDLDLMLSKSREGQYENFVYGCPLCTPTVAALELYRARPGHLYSLKGGQNTFGSGVPPEISGMLSAEKPGARLEGIRMLSQRWIGEYLRRSDYDPVSLGVWKHRIEEAKKEGGRLLEQYRHAGNVAKLAPAFAAGEDCAVCAGSTAGAYSAEELFRFPSSGEPSMTLRLDANGPERPRGPL